MSTEVLYSLMSTQRAVRRLRPDPIADDVLQRIMRAATWAPTGANRQPWRIVMVHERARKQRLGELYSVHWNNFTRMYRKRFADAPEEVQLKEGRIIAAGDYLATHFGDIPVVAVVCFNPKFMAVTDSGQDRVSVVGGGSVYTGVQNLMLACRAEGVGCVLTTLLCMDEPEVKELLQIDADWYTAAAIPMGYPVAGGYGPTTRMPVAELFYKDTWGNPI